MNRPHNVIAFPRRRAPATAGINSPRSDTAAFEDLTTAIIMARHERGELEPALLAALLQGCGFNVEAR